MAVLSIQIFSEKLHFLVFGDTQLILNDKNLVNDCILMFILLGEKSFSYTFTRFSRTFTRNEKLSFSNHTQNNNFLTHDKKHSVSQICPPIFFKTTNLYPKILRKKRHCLPGKGMSNN